MIENLENEEWKTINGYEDYQISNFGRIKSLKGKEEKILKTFINKGYKVVRFSKDGNLKWFGVHRLVAMAFIPNPNNLPQVNHIDEDTTNNHVDNLEWCTVEYNCNYGTRNKRLSELNKGANNPMYGKLGKEHPNAKQVIQLSLNGDYIKLWDSIADIEREFGYNNRKISACCSGKQRTSNGFIWQYAT